MFYLVCSDRCKLCLVCSDWYMLFSVCSDWCMLYPGCSDWVSRGSQLKKYWSGTGNKDSCLCGLDGNCDSSEVLCNCNLRDKTLRHDTGLLTNKQDLPVTGFHFRDTTDRDSRGSITLGRLNCFGLFISITYLNKISICFKEENNAETRWQLGMHCFLNMQFAICLYHKCLIQLFD